jgi:hypothetical protein
MNPLLKEGLIDALGFLGGALAGYGLGLALGLDLFAQGYSGNSIFAILLVGLGGGLGLQGLRRLLKPRK